MNQAYCTSRRRHPSIDCKWIIRLVTSAAIATALQLNTTVSFADDDPPTQPDSSTIVYDDEFFAQVNATTVEDILRRIPGVATILDGSDSGTNSQRRGFGSGGDQILIDGRRLAGKSNEISSALSRIQVQNLDRVELLRGTSNDIDVRSDGVVVNIILKEGEAAVSSGSVTLAAQLNEHGSSDLDGGINYNGELGNLSYFLSVDKNSLSTGGMDGYKRRVRDESYFYPTGELMQTGAFESDLDLEEISFAINSAYSFENNDKLQLNILIKPSRLKERTVTPFTEFAIDGSTLSSATDLRNRLIDDRLEWELGGTYEKRIGASSNFKILTVVNRDDTPSVDSRNLLTGAQLDEISRNPSDVLESEAILRSSYYWPVTGNQTLEVGAEAARNSLEQTIEVFLDQDGDGVAEKIDIFDPSSKVEEKRTEVFANHNWTISDRWTSSSSLVAENSQLSQRGVDINNTTRFRFLKPRIDVRFAPNAADQVRFKIERTVSQLNFSNFVPRYNTREDRFTAGNPNLRPETAWEYEIGFEHRLQDDHGVIAARVFYHDIQDRIESVAVDLDGDGDFDPASGNIGDGTEYGGELTFSVRLARFGAPNVIVDGGYLGRKSSVIDPFTGLERKMATFGDYTVDLGLRHDMSASNFSYGITYAFNGGRLVRREWREYRFFSWKPEVNAFLEKRFGAKWVLRFDALGFTRDKRERSRFVYADNASTGTLSRSEFYKEERDRRYTLSLTSTF